MSAWILIHNQLHHMLHTIVHSLLPLKTCQSLLCTLSPSRRHFVLAGNLFTEGTGGGPDRPPRHGLRTQT